MGKALTGLAAAAIALLAACSGGSSGSTSQPSAAVGAAAESYCALTRSYVDKYNRAPAPGESPATIRRVYQEAARDIRAALAVAPAEIRTDVSTVADGLDRLIAVLERYGYDGAQLAQAPPDALDGIDTPEFEAAGLRIEAYTNDTCR